MKPVSQPAPAETGLLYSAIPTSLGNLRLTVEIGDAERRLMTETRHRFESDPNPLLDAQCNYWERTLPAHIMSPIETIDTSDSHREPGTSVVIVAMESRLALLVPILGTLSHEFELNPFEVVIILAERWSTRALSGLRYELEHKPFRSTVVASSARAIGEKRNLGASFASGRLIVFIDDDVRLVGPVLERIIDMLEQRVDLGLVSVPSYYPDMALHRPGGYHLKCLDGERTILTNRVSGMIMATRSEIVRAAPFPAFWPNFGEDQQLSKQVHTLGYSSAYVYAPDTYLIHENVQYRLTHSPRTLSNLLMHEGVSAYLGEDWATEHLDLAARRLCVYHKGDLDFEFAKKLMSALADGFECLMDGDEAPIRELLAGCAIDGDEFVRYVDQQRRRIREYRDSPLVCFSAVSPHLGCLNAAPTGLV